MTFRIKGELILVGLFNPEILSQSNIGAIWNCYKQYLFRYASRAKSIKNKAKINEDPKDALMKQYQKEIEDLRRMLEEGRFLIIPIGGQTVYDNDIQDLTVGRMAHSYAELVNVLFRMGYSAEPREEEEEEEELFLTLWPLVTSEGSSLPTTGQRSELSGDNFVMK